MSSLPTLTRKIKTIVSPFHELLCSLHVLDQPEHHPKRLQWALGLKAQMPLSLQEAIHTLGKLSDSWTALIDLPDHAGIPVSCMDGIIELNQLPDAEFILLLLNNKVSLSTIIYTMHGKEGLLPKEDLDADLQFLLTNLSAVRKLLIATLETYERDYFRQEWDYIEPWMNIAAAEFQETAFRAPEKAINSLHPRLLAENGKISAQKAVTYYYPYHQLQHVYVFPSTFIFPHLLIGSDEDTLYLPLAVDIPGLPYSDGPPADLLRQFKALGDDTRLRILKLLWKGPYCTKQLAPILGISEAAVSKQLKQLSEAGFAKSQRKGNYLFYSGCKDAFDALIVLQRQFLEQ